MKRMVKLAEFALFGMAAVCTPMEGQQPQEGETTQQQVERMVHAVALAQAQVDASQLQLLELKQQLGTLEQRLGMQSSDPDVLQKLATSVEDLHEQQSVQESQIMTLDQTKVESGSKYPVRISGLILANAFVNTSRVDQAAAPTFATGGDGSTGLSLRQTVLGIDARGPHLGTAASHADLRVDFFGSNAQGGYSYVGGLLRLRTVHAALDWQNTSAFFELDRPILSPNAPTSLTAIANPALAWSGNLWSWSPQIGVEQRFQVGGSNAVIMQGALIDAPDPPSNQVTTPGTVNLSEQSRWPGGELRFALISRGDRDQTGLSLGIGGYISPHRTNGGDRFNAWATTADYRVPLPLHMQWSGSFYRGQALGGLGGGAYKDYIYIDNLQALNDVGGWAQWKQRAGAKLEFNEAIGIDNAFASELRGYTGTGTTPYQALARNRTFTGNAIYSPSAYLLFSIEYRNIASGFVGSPSTRSNVIGVAAGYKF